MASDIHRYRHNYKSDRNRPSDRFGVKSWIQPSERCCVIGVLSKDSEARAVQEFFQLFKTPWEFFIPGNSYDLVIATREEIPQELSASVLVVYHSHAIRFDDQIGVVTESQRRC